MRIHTLPALAAVLALAAGCHRGSGDTSKVLANVGGQKVSQADFEAVVKTMLPDPSRAEAIMKSPGFQAQKADLVRQLAMQKAVIAWARIQGLDQDPALKAQVEGALAQTYYQAMMARRQDAHRRAPLWGSALAGWPFPGSGAPSFLPFFPPSFPPSFALGVRMTRTRSSPEPEREAFTRSFTVS